MRFNKLKMWFEDLLETEDLETDDRLSSAEENDIADDDLLEHEQHKTLVEKLKWFLGLEGSEKQENVPAPQKFSEKIKSFFASLASPTSTRETKVKRPCDLVLLVSILVTLSIGLLVLAGLGGPKGYYESFFYIKRQGTFAIIGLLCMYLMSRLDYHVLFRFAWPLFIISLILAIVTLFQGTSYYGIRRWLHIANSLSIRTADVLIPACLLILSHLFSRYENMSMGKWISVFGLVAASSALLLLEPYLAAAMMLVALLALFAYIKKPIKTLLACVGLFLFSAVSVMLMGNGQYLSRLSIWKDPFSDPTGSGYQIIHSMYAFVNGGLFGKGFGAYELKYSLPELQHEFILPSVAYQLGLVGVITLLLLMTLLCIRIAIIASQAKDKQGFYLAAGICGKFVISIVLNVLMVVNLIPIFGADLPLISYGGTTLLFDLLALGIVLNISRYSRKRTSPLNGGAK